MQFESSSMDQLVRSIVATNATLIDNCPDQYSRLVEQMHTLTAGMREDILMKLLNIADDQQRNIFIRFHQRNLVALSDELVCDYHADVQTGFQYVAGEVSKLNLLKELYGCLEKLSGYISRTFSGYICTDIEIPLVRKIMITGAVKKMLKDMEKRFRSTGVNDRLSGLIMDVVSENIDTGCQEALTFRRSDWLLDFLMNVRNILDRHPDTAQRRLHMLLCIHNMNHADMLEYCKDTVHAKVHAIDSPAGKIEKLALIRKRINQFTYIDDRVYDTSLPDMKSQLNNWISVEISYLENHITPGLPQTTTQETTLPADQKIHFSLNASELACMMNIAETVGVVEMRYKKTFMEAAAQMFATANKEDFNYDSIHTLYYKNNPHVLKVVRSRIMDMANEATKRLGQIKK